MRQAQATEDMRYLREGEGNDRDMERNGDIDDMCENTDVVENMVDIETAQE